MVKLNLILNEKKYIEKIIQCSELPDTISPYAMVTYLTKYYYNKDISLKELTDIVCEQMNKFNIPIEQYQEYKGRIRVKKVYNEIVSNKTFMLKEYEYIPLYKSEYDKIMQCETDREKKLLFTIYILARYTNNYGWVYFSEKDIYRLANVSNTNKNQIDLIAKLIHEGFIKETKRINDLKIGVNLSDNKDEKIILKINKLSYLGNQFIAFIKPEYKVCGGKDCGKLIKIKNKNDHSTKYCNDCAYKMKLKKNNEYYYKKQ